MYYVKYTLGRWVIFSPEGEAVANFNSDNRFDGSILARHTCDWMNSQIGLPKNRSKACSGRCKLLADTGKSDCAATGVCAAGPVS